MDDLPYLTLCDVVTSTENMGKRGDVNEKWLGVSPFRCLFPLPMCWYPIGLVIVFDTVSRPPVDQSYTLFVRMNLICG